MASSRPRRSRPTSTPGSSGPEAAAAADELLAEPVAAGTLRILRRHVPRVVEVEDDRVRAVELIDLRGGDPVAITADYVLDATEEGNLLPLASCEYALGGDGRAATAEPDTTDEARADCQQAITWCFALEHRPGEDHTIGRPDEYAFWSQFRAPFWPGPQLGWVTREPETGGPLHRPLFGDGQDLWTFRRIRDAGHYTAGWTTDITVVNWPQVDYWLSPVVDVPSEQREDALRESRALGRSFLYWLQTDAPRPDGGTGSPGLRLASDILGTPDDFAQRHYTREPPRAVAATSTCRRGPSRSPSGALYLCVYATCWPPASASERPT